uniref:Kinesin motor domain-containing protein n=1 Tax=Chromera velia CCMP2878 TaxID=1169474 RepID=A0A0G4GHN7_9ALVE|eukprot:Cvel_21938.t1-p1 / transcript=Cvel_21938.t1 / gene=Cvel_21938 / organism=Chromera_velia_CCMP2878 / gene_product=Kinesin-related protein 5, putative / transcript_product=Kinesin-related protein 5, putative / location=Cvel_scaffold2105:21534-26032(-) / protein_length=208 / sequence_SO=supercontig / SO=protein_coding / is_pseudo=false
MTRMRPFFPKEDYIVSCSYLEIYMERVNDLLSDDGKGGPVQNLPVKEDAQKGFFVPGLEEKIVTSAEEVLSLIARSSRSHVVFILKIESQNEAGFEGGSGPPGSNSAGVPTTTKLGKLNLVDLAGNERVALASAGTEDAKKIAEEGKVINTSLFFLSECISKLAARAATKGGKKALDAIHVPYRDSKLTRILQVGGEGTGGEASRWAA